MKAHLGSLLIAAAIVTAAMSYAFVNRYSFHYEDRNTVYVFDHWTGHRK